MNKILLHSLLVSASGLLALNALAEAPNTTTTTTTTTIPKVDAITTTVVGVSSRDGITVSGTDVLVTRNGITEKLTKEMELSNGVRVQPGGSIVTKAGAKITLRPSQILGFDGNIINDPITESVAPKILPVHGAAPNAAYPSAHKTKEAAAEEARVNSERRNDAARKGPIKAGEGVQK